MIGMGERTTPVAVEILTRRLFETVRPVGSSPSNAAQPRLHAPGHGDDDARRVDVHPYPYIDKNLRSWTITPGTNRERST